MHLDLQGEIVLGINGRVSVAGGCRGVMGGRRSGSSTALRPDQPPHCMPKQQPVREPQTYLRAAATRCRRNRGDAVGDVAGGALLEGGDTHAGGGTALKRLRPAVELKQFCL